MNEWKRKCGSFWNDQSTSNSFRFVCNGCIRGKERANAYDRPLEKPQSFLIVMDYVLFLVHRWMRRLASVIGKAIDEPSNWWTRNQKQKEEEEEDEEGKWSSECTTKKTKTKKQMCCSHLVVSSNEMMKYYANRAPNRREHRSLSDRPRRSRWIVSIDPIDVDGSTPPSFLQELRRNGGRIKSESIRIKRAAEREEKEGAEEGNIKKDWKRSSKKMMNEHRDQSIDHHHHHQHHHHHKTRSIALVRVMFAVIELHQILLLVRCAAKRFSCFDANASWNESKWRCWASSRADQKRMLLLQHSEAKQKAVAVQRRRRRERERKKCSTGGISIRAAYNCGCVQVEAFGSGRIMLIEGCALMWSRYTFSSVRIVERKQSCVGRCGTKKAKKKKKKMGRARVGGQEGGSNRCGMCARHPSLVATIRSGRLRKRNAVRVDERCIGRVQKRQKWLPERWCGCWCDVDKWSSVRWTLGVSSTTGDSSHTTIDYWWMERIRNQFGRQIESRSRSSVHQLIGSKWQTE